MKENISTNPGIYIHIPFCEHKCGYCDFYSVTQSSHNEAFISALLHEISLVKDSAAFDKHFDTIYLGGGTPSLLEIWHLEKIFGALKAHFPFERDTETTIEINPGTVDYNKLSAYKTLGINRLSIGVQSFNDDELRFLERIHNSAQARKAIESARRAGFDNIGLDLISALPAHSLSSWEKNLKEALSYRPEHLSVYNLTYEQGTPFYQRLQKGEIVPKSEQNERRLMERTIGILQAQNYIPYEVSNFAREISLFSRHNYKYWNHSPYLGLGPSAHSFWNNRRRGNFRSLSQYIAALNRNELPRAFNEEINAAMLEFEHILLRLRTYQGLNMDAFERKFGHPFLKRYRQITSVLVKEELAAQSGERFYLTQEGMYICDEILARFNSD